MVPDGWRLTGLDGVRASIIDGDRGKNYPKKDDYLSDGYALFLGAENIVDGSFDLNKKIFISKEKHEAMRKGVVQDKDIILVMRGNGTGRSCIFFSDKLKGKVARINSGLIIIRPSLECADVNFLHQLFLSDIIKKQFDSVIFGSAQPQLTVKLLKSLTFPVPPYPEQVKIAHILSVWDKKILLTEQLLKNSQQQKKSLMQKLLTGKKRLLDKNGRRFNSEWKSCRLGDIGEIKSAGVDKKIVEGEAPVRLLNFTDVFKKTFIFADEINHWVTAPYSKVDGCSVLKGDVFFTPSSETRDEVGMSAVVAADIDSCCYSYHIVRFRIKENWDLNFKAFAFSTPTFRKQVSLLADGSGQRYVVSQDGFRSVMISYPPIEEQREIGKVLKLAEEETIILDKKLNYLKQEKKALMQQLLTGKRRVKTEVA